MVVFTGHRQVRFAAVAALVGIAAAVVWSAGCADDPAPLSLSTSGSGGAGGGPGHQGKEMFLAIQDEVLTACGACHELGGSADTPFLGEPTSGALAIYEAITSWPGIVVRDPDTSVLYTWPRFGQHTGGPTDPKLEEKLLAWLAEEAKGVAVVEGGKPTIPPFKPIVPGFNAVYLDPLGTEFIGMAVTFMADELTDSTLSLTEIEVHPTSKMGLRFEHPLFTVYPAGEPDGDPDPVDSFSNVVQEIEAGQSAPLGPGTLVLTNWVGGGKISINFETVEPVDPMGGMGGAGGGGAVGPCEALTAFDDNARGPLSQNCASCHGGNNQTATNAVDMSELDTNSASTCGQILNRVNLGNPPASQIFITTDPNGNASHPFKFGGNANDFNAFTSAVTTWIQAEAM